MEKHEAMLARLREGVRPKEDVAVRHNPDLVVTPTRSRYTKDQQQAIEAAAELRGMKVASTTGKMGYVNYAALAFAAYDLELDLFELLTGRPLPADPSTAEQIQNAARSVRGQWGIVDLSDYPRGGE